MLADRQRERQDGATAVEYSIMLVLIAAVIVAVVAVLGNQSCEQFETTSTRFGATGVVTPAGSC